MHFVVYISITCIFEKYTHYDNIQGGITATQKKTQEFI